MRFTTPSPVHAVIPATAKRISKFSVNDYFAKGASSSAMDSLSKDLHRIGITVSPEALESWTTMDALQPLQTTASIGVPVQYLQQLIPGYVRVATGKRAIDELIGIQIIGDWEDEQVVQGVIENTGSAVPYGDYTNVPLSAENNNFVVSSVVRFERGLQVGRLEAARQSKIQIDIASEKRLSAIEALEIARNNVGFNGYNSGANQTFGFLNAPSLPAYIAAPNLDFSTSTYLEISNDLLFAFSLLQNNTQGLVDPRKDATTLALPTNSITYLSTSTEFGYTVWKWLADNYPECRVVSAPQLNLANGGANVLYLYADSIDNGSTDGGSTWAQNVQSKMMTLGTQQLTKSYEEDMSNATAGVMAKRPYAIVRLTGI